MRFLLFLSIALMTSSCDRMFPPEHFEFQALLEEVMRNQKGIYIQIAPVEKAHK